MLFCMFGTLKDAIKLKWFHAPHREKLLFLWRDLGLTPKPSLTFYLHAALSKAKILSNAFIQLLYCWSIIVSNWVAFANDILAKNGGKVKMLET